VAVPDVAVKPFHADGVARTEVDTRLFLIIAMMFGKQNRDAT
jgi:hypothetical protein